MAYCTKDDILARIGPQVLADLCRDPEPDIFDSGIEIKSAAEEEAEEKILQNTISEACAMIRACCQGRYHLPERADFDNKDPLIPEMVRLLAVDFSIYALYARRAHSEVPESVRRQRDQALDWLWSVQRGELGLGNDAEIYRISQASSCVSGGPRLFARTAREARG